MPDQELFEALWVYTGRRWHLGTLYHTWSPLKGDAIEADEQRTVWYKGKNLTNAYPGSVYKVKSAVADFSKTFGKGSRNGPEYITRYPEGDELLRWKLLDEEAEVADRLEKERKQDMSRNEIQECLAPIREAMATVSPAGKRRIIAIVIEYLTR